MHLIALLYMLVIDNENKENWNLCFDILKKHYIGLDCKSVTIVSDQDKGLRSAVADQLPQALSFRYNR